jgi:aminocarboxymuconate-semialdehyde decarboxylase
MFFSGAPRAPEHADGGGRRGARRAGSSRVIDIHCHRQSDAAAAAMQVESERLGRAALTYGNDLSREVNRKQLETVRPKMRNLEERFADMDAQGVDIQVISVPPFQFYYWADAELTRDVHRAVNDEMAEIAAAHPDRIRAMATVPLQNTAMAVAELERCVKEHGMRAVAVGTNVDGAELSDPVRETFFTRAEELGVLIFMHPESFTHQQRFGDHYFINLFGHPLDSSLAIGRLIFDGVIERHPDLKICVAHGGGFLPAYPGRIDHAWKARADCRVHIARPPGTYLKKFHFDTMVFDPGQLGFLIRTYGADRILLGTDYPFDMGEQDPRGLIGRVEGLGDAERAAISGGNAARLLGF